MRPVSTGPSRPRLADPELLDPRADAYWQGEHDRKRIGEVALDFSEIVQMALAGLEEDPTLPGILTRLNTQAYELALRHEVASAGGNLHLVRITNPDVLAELEAEAKKWSKKITQTFERDLMRFVGVAQANGATEAELPGLIAQWNVSRSAWKDAEIAITESARSAGMAQKEFIKRTGATGRARFGNSLKCSICQGIAASNPYALDDPMVGSLGHVGCLDYWHIEYDAGVQPWLGD
jgi:hypothetical protein